ncbi:MAG: DNA-packaging protein [Hydrogenophilaceae bacterium]|jgi:phage terminase large subunit-like protein|nr:DNA-packaging protein [Hydrogenophilaceae bacterium]
MARAAEEWETWAHESQLPPRGPWRTWVFLGGRGAGKTRAGAEWIKALIRDGRARRIALIAPTLLDARAVMLEGPSGLLSGWGERPQFAPSLRRLEWRNGAVAHFFSAEDPPSLRGPQFDAAWGDEFCFWAHPQETLDTLAHALRLGDAPRLAITTTPRPLPALLDLLQRKDTQVTQASTFANRRNLSRAFIAGLEAAYRGTPAQRQEIGGELIEQLEGALWSREQLERLRVESAPELDRIVVAVDPPLTVGAGADACGIVAAGACGQDLERRAFVLADASVQGASPEAWSARVAALAREVGAHAIIAEGNAGGELVRTTLRLVAGDVPVSLRHARFSKRERAQPVALLYAHGRVKHVGVMPALEEEMCAFGAKDFRGSPDRMDALVWAIDDLLLHPALPNVRRL